MNQRQNKTMIRLLQTNIFSFLFPYLEQTDLNVQGEAVEGHGADEGDPGGHRVHDLRVPVEPEPLQLGQHVQRLELLQVEDLGVREPELLDEGHVHRDPLRLGLLGVILVHHTKYFSRYLQKR